MRSDSAREDSRAAVCPRSSRRVALRQRSPAIVLSLLALSGCSSLKVPGAAQVWDALSAWEGDFTAAEQRAHRQDRALLIYYTKSQAWDADPMLEALKGPEAQGRTGDFVHCLLTPAHEPNRRYVNQFGVDRTPAIIILHRDGTYQAAQGPKSPQEVRDFLASASPPGEHPTYNPNVPRPIRYAWVSSLEKAQSAAQDRDAPVFAVIDRPFTLDWQRLSPMLERREVFSRVAHMVHCRPGLWKLGVGEAQRRFNLDDLPAIVLLHPDGRFDVLKLPNSYEAIARFIDSASAPAPTETISAAQPLASSPN